MNSLLLAPHVALHEAGVPVSSVLRPDVLERTGIRAALAYLRIAAAGDAMAPSDIVEILRRPTRGLPQWFPDRLHRRARWSLPQLVTLADQVPDKDAPKVLRLVDDLQVVADAGRAGTTRHVLEAVRDDVGLGAAMGLLDRTGGGQGSSHLDDLDGLLGVADLHPDPGGFEPWLRAVFKRETAPDGVTLSTVHRVKGREWDRVAVFGVTDGIVPAPPRRGRRGGAPGAARRHHPRPPPRRRARRPHPPQPVPRRARRHRPEDGADGPFGGGARDRPRPREGGARRHRGRRRPRRHRARRVRGDDRRGRRSRGATVRLASGATMRVRFGERVERDGRKAPLAAPTELWGAAASAEAQLRAWRTKRSQADGVPAYIVVNDKHLRGIALARPTTPAELVACDGIGPAKLERYGDEILELLAEP